MFAQMLRHFLRGPALSGNPRKRTESERQACSAGFHGPEDSGSWRNAGSETLKRLSRDGPNLKVDLIVKSLGSFHRFRALSRMHWSVGCSEKRRNLKRPRTRDTCFLSAGVVHRHETDFVVFESSGIARPGARGVRDDLRRIRRFPHRSIRNRYNRHNRYNFGFVLVGLRSRGRVDSIEIHFFRGWQT